MGRSSNYISSTLQSSATESIIMLTHSEKIEHFWDLELLGIKEPTEKTSREKEVVKFLNDSLSTDLDGRYMVKLPWIDNSSLPNNKNLAGKRLLATTSKLISSGRYSDYNSVLGSWEDEKIIEEILEGGREGRCHYLPHHGVFKEGSTTPLRPVFDATRLLWDRKEDLLFCDTSHTDTECEPMSRRNVLSCIQKVFDPIGFTRPVTIIPKLLLQET
ncbi:pro-Pol polyprotein [Nephila pilipes]|uniref:Pro-Pol polyprotein n=1 Tax=Nephila pilipes TaxID=299642 RepID=A0A8X6JRJ9_NEPPI|nr:pro-Pol polyprotein [Nephila pilipes]